MTNFEGVRGCGRPETGRSDAFHAFIVGSFATRARDYGSERVRGGAGAETIRRLDFLVMTAKIDHRPISGSVVLNLKG